MTITKGFLRQKFSIERHLMITGILFGTFIAYLLYKLFYYIFQGFRYLTHLVGDQILVELTPREHFFYNLFYGSVAAITGLYTAFAFSLGNSHDGRNIKRRFRKRNILSELGFNELNFLHAFSRFLVLVGLLYVSFSLQFYIDFFEDFKLALILVPVVLFLNLWPALLRAMGKSGYRWVFYSFLYVVALSLIFASSNYQRAPHFDLKLKKNRIDFAYSLQLPQSESFETIELSYLATDIYLALDSSQHERPLFFWRDMTGHYEYENIPVLFTMEMGRRMDSERNAITANLFIDERVKMKYVNELKSALSKAYFNRVQYSTLPKHSKHPSNHPLIKYSGIRFDIPRFYSPAMEAFLDSAESLDISKYQIFLPRSGYRIHDIRKVNRIKLTVTPDRTLVNGQPVADQALREILYRFFKKYSPHCSIIYEPDEEIAYGKYIHYLDMLYSATDRLRQEMSFRLNGEPFDFSFCDTRCDSIISKYPRNVIEWTPGEKRLMALVKKSGRPVRMM